jgi:uncharacterized protein (TIGR00661 family)
MKYSGNKIVYSVLNWGLGHAARSIPLIKNLIESGNTVVIASNGGALIFLKEVFPDNQFVELPDYGAQYRWNNMAMNIAMQAPTMFKAVMEEHKILNDMHEKEDFDVAISDQRYGCYIEDIPSFFITHQVNIRGRKRLTTTMANKLHQNWLGNFKEIWVPDVKSSPGLAGFLSHAEMPQDLYYLGPISRFDYNGESSPEEADYDWAFILSGPEPARTKLEELILELLEKDDCRAVLVRGKPDDNSDRQISENVRMIGHLHEKDLRALIYNSKGIISRSGYSTIMDLCALHRPAVLIPTPGQPEQIHLAELLSKQYRWPVRLQSEFNKIPSLRCLDNALPLPEVDLDKTTSIMHRRLSFA